MSEKEWEKLFELIGKVVNLPGMSADEKGQEIRRQAKEHGADGDLEEFVSECNIIND